MNRPIWKSLAVAMAVGLSACGDSDSDNNNANANANALELVNPIPGTEIQLVTEDGQNHGPAQRVTLENAGNLTVPVGEMIVLRAMVVFGDGYMADVTEHTYFQVTGEGLNLSPRTDAGVPASGFAEGIAKISLLLGSLAQPTIDVAVTPALLKTLVISAPSAEVPRNGTLALTVSGTYGDGTTLDVSTVATWSSSDDSTATVTNSGVVAGVADGGVTISAVYEGQTTTTDLSVICVYPGDEDTVRPFRTLPNISFTNVVFPDGSQGPLSLEDVYCREDGLDTYDVIFIQLSAEWCQPCRAVRASFRSDQDVFADNNALPLFIELEDFDGQQNVTSVMANESLARELLNDFGVRAGDFDAIPQNVFSRSYAADEFNALPTMAVVRTRDMQVIATSASQYTEFLARYPEILANPEWNWEDVTDPVRQ